MTAKEFFQGRWMRHPVHPLLVHFPIGLWVTALVFDLIALGGGGNAFVRAAQYTLVGGLIGAALASVFGVADMLTRTPRASEPRQIALVHMALNLAVVVVFVVDVALRAEAMEAAAPPTLAFVLSILGVAVLAAAGYLGGVLVYQHGIGLTLEKTSEAEKRRLGHAIRERPASKRPPAGPPERPVEVT